MEHVYGLADFESKANFLVIFKSPEKHLGRCLRVLEQLGVGVNPERGSIDMIALAATKPPLLKKLKPGETKRRRYRVDDRMTTEEILQTIDDSSHLTFDYLANIVVGGVIAAVGLLTDSPVTVVASMLVSPLMGPILAIAFGLTIGDFDMVARGFRNELIGLFLCYFIGILTGLSCGPFFDPLASEFGIAFGVNSTIVSSEMSSRGTPWSLLSGFFVAMPSGVGVALGISGGGINALVGVAISAALLPPIVNSGLCHMLAIWHTSLHNGGEMHRFLQMGMYSMLLFLLNLFCIIVFAMLTFRLKRVGKSHLLAEDPHYSSAYSFRLSGTGKANGGGGGNAQKEAYVELEERGGASGGQELAVSVT